MSWGSAVLGAAGTACSDAEKGAEGRARTGSAERTMSVGLAPDWTPGAGVKKRAAEGRGGASFLGAGRRGANASAVDQSERRRACEIGVREESREGRGTNSWAWSPRSLPRRRQQQSRWKERTWKRWGRRRGRRCLRRGCRGCRACRPCRGEMNVGGEGWSNDPNRKAESSAKQKRRRIFDL